MHGGIAVELKCKAKVMDAAAIDRTLVRIAHEILEKNDGTEDLCLIGIHTRGVPAGAQAGREHCAHRRCASAGR